MIAIDRPAEAVENQPASGIAEFCQMAQPFEQYGRNGTRVRRPLPGKRKREANNQSRVVLQTRNHSLLTGLGSSRAASLEAGRCRWCLGGHDVCGHAGSPRRSGFSGRRLLKDDGNGKRRPRRHAPQLSRLSSGRRSPRRRAAAGQSRRGCAQVARRPRHLQAHPDHRGHRRHHQSSDLHRSRKGIRLHDPQFHR